MASILIFHKMTPEQPIIGTRFKITMIDPKTSWVQSSSKQLWVWLNILWFLNTYFMFVIALSVSFFSFSPLVPIFIFVSFSFSFFLLSLSIYFRSFIFPYLPHYPMTTVIKWRQLAPIVVVKTKSSDHFSFSDSFVLVTPIHLVPIVWRAN